MLFFLLLTLLYLSSIDVSKQKKKQSHLEILAQFEPMCSFFRVNQNYFNESHLLKKGLSNSPGLTCS